MRRFAWSLGAVVLVGLAGLLGLRVHSALGDPPLEPWHRYSPPELPVRALDRSDWDDYLAHEEETFGELQRELGSRLPESGRYVLNRYAPASIVNPRRFARDWNRSYLLEPASEVRGIVVLLHGLTDSPYSLRHVAKRYQERGFVAIGPRLPGHGTTPAGLIATKFEDWLATTRLAMREAARRQRPGEPLHVVGYSNGAALALLYALQADGTSEQPRPTRLILISPMIGVSAHARFAGLVGLPALLPSFAKAAWIDVYPEFNPFKYNSFPVHAARETHRLTTMLQAQVVQPERAAQLPPILAFQSVLDSTVSTPAVITGLFDRLPVNGSALILFDINRAAYFEPFLKPGTDVALGNLLPTAARGYELGVVTNGEEGALLRTRRAGDTVEETVPLAANYPAEMYSLSHIALPFPVTDSLYGRYPHQLGEFGLSLGTLSPRGERGVLLMNSEAVLRVSSNPFFDLVIGKIDMAIDADLAR